MEGIICNLQYCSGFFIAFEKCITYTEQKWEIKNKLFCDK